MTHILPVYKKEMVYIYCEICDYRGSGTKQNNIYHYNQHKKTNAFLLEKIRDNETRVLLGLEPIEEILSLNCEICNVNIECEEMYFVHLIEYHNLIEILNSVKNEKILNILIENNFLSFKCELCGNYLEDEFTRENYQIHLKEVHKSELNFKIVKKIKDHNVLENILLNCPKENKTRLRTRINDEKTMKITFEGDDFLEEIYRERREGEEDENFICEVCQYNVEGYLEDYIAHLLQHSFNFSPEWKMYQQVTEIFTEANYFNFNCEICGLNIGSISKYYLHLKDKHYKMGMELVKYVTDYYSLSQTLRKYIINKKLQNYDDHNLNNSNIQIQIPSSISQNNNAINFNQSGLSQNLNSTKLDSNMSTYLNSVNESNTYLEEKRKCDICEKEVDSSYELYACHLISEHTKDEIYESSSIPHYVLFILANGVMIPIKCEICGKELSEDVNEYISHISNSHFSMTLNDIYTKLKDKYVLNSILKSNNLSTINENLSNISLTSINNYDLNTSDISLKFNNNHVNSNVNSQFSNNIFSNENKKNCTNHLCNSKVSNDIKEKLLNDKKNLLKELKELNVNDTMFDEQIIDLEKEIKRLSLQK